MKKWVVASGKSRPERSGLSSSAKREATQTPEDIIKKLKKKNRSGKNSDSEHLGGAKGTAGENGSSPAQSPAASKSGKRYILFVGGLPYHSSHLDIKKFFGKSLAPHLTSVRLLSEKGSNKPKGCAFVEFANKESYTKALGVHGHLLDGRKIRVETTVGGGGRGESREFKLKAKRQTLQRLRRKKVRKLKKESDLREPGGTRRESGSSEAANSQHCMDTS